MTLGTHALSHPLLCTDSAVMPSRLLAYPCHSKRALSLCPLSLRRSFNPVTSRVQCLVVFLICPIVWSGITGTRGFYSQLVGSSPLLSGPLQSLHPTTPSAFLDGTQHRGLVHRTMQLPITGQHSTVSPDGTPQSSNQLRGTLPCVAFFAAENVENASACTF